MYTTTDSIYSFGNNYNSDYYDSAATTASAGLIIAIIVGILVCIAKVAFWVWICHRWSRRQRPVIIERNVVVQSNTTMAAPVQMMMPGQYMPQGNQYGMPQGNQYGMPPGTHYGNPPAYYPPGSYSPPHMPVGDGAPRSVDVDPRVGVSQKDALVENQ